MRKQIHQIKHGYLPKFQLVGVQTSWLFCLKCAPQSEELTLCQPLRNLINSKAQEYISGTPASTNIFKSI